MACTPTCVTPTPSQAHCAAAGCHQTFGGVSSFDQHRRGGGCLQPTDLGLRQVRGVWRQPPPPPEVLERIQSGRSRP